MQRKIECISGKERLRQASWYIVRRDIPRFVLGRLESFHGLERGGKRKAIVARYFHFAAPRPELALPLALGRYRSSAK